jgi:hypothetical protein
VDSRHAPVEASTVAADGTARRARGLGVLSACLLASAFALGCDRTAVETWLAEGQAAENGPSLFSAEPMASCARAFQERLGPKIQALSLLVYSDHAVLQARNPADTTKVEQWVYRRGIVSDPVAVKLLGTGHLEDNLFPLWEVDLAALPKLVEDARKRVDMPEGVVARVLVKRDLPSSMDVRFKVFVSSQRRDAFVSADAKGQLLAPESKP